MLNISEFGALKDQLNQLLEIELKDMDKEWSKISRENNEFMTPYELIF